MVRVDLGKRLIGMVPSHVLASDLPGRTLLGERGGSFMVSGLIRDSALCPSFLAFDARGERVVVKVFRPEVMGEPERDRVLTHHRTLCEIVKGGRAPALRAPVDQGLLERFRTGDFELATMVFTVAEFVEGRSLEDLSAARQLLLRSVIPALEAAARAVGALSETGQPHRNLKLSNLILGDDGTTRLADALPFHLTSLESATLLLAPMDTDIFAAPELNHYSTAPHDRVDVFGFAHLVFRLLTGHSAWRVGSPSLDTIATGFRSPLRLSSCLHQRPADFADLGVADALEALLRRGLSARESRYGSVWELWEAIRPLLGRALAPPPRPLAPPSAAGFPQPVGERQLVKPPGGVIRSVSFLPQRRTLVALAEGQVLTAALDREVGYRDQLSWKVLPTTGVDVTRALGVLAHERGPIVWSAGRRDQLTWEGKLMEGVADADVTWLSGVLDHGRAYLLGMRLAPPCAVVAEVGAEGRHVVWGSPALVSAARLPNGGLVACGDDGALVLFRDQPDRLAWGRTGHLRALVANAEGMAFAVGSGGHALSIDSRPTRPTVTLEAVETTQDLLGLCLDNAGTPWAWSRNGRLVRRDATGVWRRFALSITEAGVAGAFSDSGGICVVMMNGSAVQLVPPD